MNDEAFLTYGEAAKILRIAPTTLRKKVMLKAIPHIKPFGRKGRVLFSRDALEAMLAANSVAVAVGSGRVAADESGG